MLLQLKTSPGKIGLSSLLNCQQLTILCDRNDMLERQKTFEYVRYNSNSAVVIRDLRVLHKSQNPQRPLVFRMAYLLKCNNYNIIVIFNN